MKKKLTIRQNDILQFIQNFINENEYPPTYREIGKNFGIASTFGVKRHLDALQKKGYIFSESFSSRAIKIRKSPDLSNINPAQSTVEIPILGRIAAGVPIWSAENIDGTLFIDTSLISKSKECFGLRVQGDSMIDAGILEGDIVLVNSQNDAESGEIVVGLVGEESTLKKIIKTRDKIFLKPENSKYPILDMSNRDDFSIVGKVIGVYRSYN